MNAKCLSASLFALICAAPLCAFAQNASTAAANGSPPATLDNSAANPNPKSNPNTDPNVIGAQDTAASATAQAQSSNGNVPMNPRNPPMPPTVDTAPAADAPTAVVANNSADQTFTTLDSSHKGYLSLADVASHKYLAGHFQQCDGNHDLRLSKDEVSACLKQTPPAQQ